MKRSTSTDEMMTFACTETLKDGHAYPINPKLATNKKRLLEDQPTPASPQLKGRSTSTAAEPEYHRDPSVYANPTPTEKAYRNADFLNSSHARPLRILAEYEETMQRLAANGIKATVQFFGSARAKDGEKFETDKAKAESELSNAEPGTPQHAEAEAALKKLAAIEWMVEYMDKTRQLARRLTLWSIDSRLGHSAQNNGVSRNKSLERLDKLVNLHDKTVAPQHGDGQEPAEPKAKYTYPAHVTDAGGSSNSYTSHHAGLYVCTGGGPGFMEAANRGASDVSGGRSIGMGISLPFEKGLNPYVSDELAFEFHYFFTRKFAMAFHMQALVVAPGGFGTCDEMFEIMTLKQTGKMQKNLPIVLLGKAHWLKVIDWKAFAESGTIAQKDVDELLFTDDVDEAFEFITERLIMN